MLREWCDGVTVQVCPGSWHLPSVWRRNWGRSLDRTVALPVFTAWLTTPGPCREGVQVASRDDKRSGTAGCEHLRGRACRWGAGRGPTRRAAGVELPVAWCGVATERTNERVELPINRPMSVLRIPKRALSRGLRLGRYAAMPSLARSRGRRGLRSWTPAASPISGAG